MTPYRERRQAGYYQKGGPAAAAQADTPSDDRTVAELQDELRARDLPVSGTKDELIARLNEDA